MFGIFAGQLIVKRADFKNYDKTKLLLILATACISISHAKLIPFFVITSSIFLFDDVFELINKNSMLKWINNPENKYIYGLIIFITAFTFYILFPLMYESFSPIKYPYEAVEFIKKKQLSGNLFTDMTYGSYCAYKLYPQNKIFMDGRYEEVYSPKLLKEIKNFAKQEGDKPMKVIYDYPTDIVLLFGTKCPLSMKLQKLGWKPIYKDYYWIILVRPDYPYNDEPYNYFAKDKKENFKLDKYEYFNTKLLETDITKEMLPKD